MGAGASSGADIGRLVQDYVDGRVEHLSRGVAYRAPAALVTLASSSSGSNKRSLKSMKSLKSMALKSYSRQENVYIPHESILSASASLYSSKLQGSGSKSGPALATVGSTGSLSSGNGSKPGSMAGSFRKTPPSSNPNLVAEVPAAVAGAAVVVPIVKKGLKPNLRISIQDDADWIQVSDDEGGDDDATAKTKTPRKELSLMPHAQQSYLFTQSGTIFVDGFKEGIGKDGIHAQETSSSKLGLHDRIVFLAKLGAGASGVVYKALDLWEMRLVAVKTIPMFDRAKRRQCVREVSILFSILRAKNSVEGMASVAGHSAATTRRPFGKKPHEYIVDFHDAFSNIDDGGVAIMMEYMDGGSLQDIVNDGGCDDESTLANIAHQGLEGLAFLHDCAQLHRDLKPGNFLISKHGDCKIADLGILRQMDPSDQLGGTSPSIVNTAEGDSIPRAQTFVGTATYMSPERIDGRDYSYPSDIWSFGLSLLTVALGRLPINTQGGYWTILHSIRDDKPPAVPDDGRFSPEFQDFVRCMLQRKPEDRQSAIQLLSHPFLVKAGTDDGEAEKLFDDELGVAELTAIFAAVAQHLERRKAEQIRSASLNVQDNGIPDSLEQLLGNLQHFTLAEALEMIFLRGRDVGALALQLHLPAEKLIATLEKMVHDSRSVPPPMPDALLCTPKASHGRGGCGGGRR